MDNNIPQELLDIVCSSEPATDEQIAMVRHAINTTLGVATLPEMPGWLRRNAKRICALNRQEVRQHGKE